MNPTKPIDPTAAAKLYDVAVALLEYWDHGTPVHPSALIVRDVRAAVHRARRSRGEKATRSENRS